MSELTVDLSIRLLREGVALSEVLKQDHHLSSFESEFGILYYGKTEATPPLWADFLETGSPGLKSELSNQQSSAVLLIQTVDGGINRIFAICFGQGHHAVDSDRIERQFGLRVVLNTVSRTDLRTLDSASLDSTVIQKRTQASRDSDLQLFGLDTQREILRLASGRPSNSDIAKAVSGKDALQIRKKISLDILPLFCEELLGLYKSTDYLKDFRFIDNVKPVHDRSLIASLDAEIFAELQKIVDGKASDLHLAIPDMLSPSDSTEIAYYGVHLPIKKRTFWSIDIEDYVNEIKRGTCSKLGDMSDFRLSHEVRVVVDNDKSSIGSVKVYNCFVFESVRPDGRYVLFDGQWFEVDATYAKEIENAYLAVKKTSFLASTNSANEQELIKELCGTSYPTLLCLDQTKSSPAGAKGANLEVCDFLSTSGQLIHLKDGHSSAPLSHLWNQGIVSVESLVRDDSFRKDVRRAIKKREGEHGRTGFQTLIPSGHKIDPTKYTVVFGVMRCPYKHTKTIGLPFFSKVALRAAADRLTLMGFKTELHLIEKT